MSHDEVRLNALEAINDKLIVLHTQLKGFHDEFGDLGSFSSTHCDTTAIDGFADDLDGFKADEIEPMLEIFRNEAEREYDRQEYEYEQIHIAMASSSLRTSQ